MGLTCSNIQSLWLRCAKFIYTFVSEHHVRCHYNITGRCVTSYQYMRISTLLYLLLFQGYPYLCTYFFLHSSHRRHVFIVGTHGSKDPKLVCGVLCCLGNSLFLLAALHPNARQAWLPVSTAFPLSTVSLASVFSQQPRCCHVYRV